jgi:hypothetical protein
MLAVERFGFEPVAALAGRPLFLIFSDPGFPTLAGGWITAGESECGDFGV